MTAGSRLGVVIEAGALRDGRASAGIGRYVRSLAAALGELDGIDLHLSLPRRAPRSERHPIRYLHAQPALIRTVIRRRPVVVHAVTSEPVIGWPLSRQVVTVHDVIPWASADHRGGALARSFFAVQAVRLRRCAAIIAVSPRVAHEAASVLGIRDARITVVAEGVDAGFNPVPSADDGERRARAGVGDGPYMLWAGSLAAHDPRKALDILIRAAAEVHHAAPGTTLVMAGATGTEAQRVRGLAAAAGVPLVTPGFVSDDDLAALYRGAAVSVVPSLDEGFGLPVLEALACGSPLVATRAGNIPDLAGDAALLVPPADADALAAALTAVLRGAAPPTMRERGLRRAREFSWKRAAEETLGVYRSVAAGRRGGV